jgi:UDPglucose--hexose-1-phosphate uridylyltransferase
LTIQLQQEPHRRFNPLTGEWILVSPHRTARPWQGQVEESTPAPQVRYDPNCYLCPGNARAGGVRNPDYKDTFVFTNDFSALYPEVAAQSWDADNRGLLVAESEKGICRVLCFSPRHDLTLSTMAVPNTRRVVDLWADQSQELGSLDFIRYVQIFENRGAMMGASNPHPHGQIWASASLPNEPQKELLHQRRYEAENHRCLLCDYIALESKLSERVVFENDEVLVVVPFWALWPFETLVLIKAHIARIEDLVSKQRDGLAAALQKLTSGYDRLFNVSFPYSAGFHCSPYDGEAHSEWHLHAHFYPPLLRSASIRKFMVGYEMLATPQRDITPEAAAQRLRETLL